MFPESVGLFCKFKRMDAFEFAEEAVLRLGRLLLAAQAYGSPWEGHRTSRFTDTVIVKTVGCLACPSALSKTVSSSTNRMLSQTQTFYKNKKKEGNRDRVGVQGLSPAFHLGYPLSLHRSGLPSSRTIGSEEGKVVRSKD
jgi:hypothetical protein